MPRAPFQVLVLPYRHDGGTLQAAVFKRADYKLWQFISGGGEQGEPVEAAARREAREEAGIPNSLDYQRLDTTTTIPACWFSAWTSWSADVLVIPEYSFAVDVGDHELQISDEHSQFEWLDYDSAMRHLRFDSNKNALWELRERLMPQPRTKRPAYR